LSRFRVDSLFILCTEICIQNARNPYYNTNTNSDIITISNINTNSNAITKAN